MEDQMQSSNPVFARSQGFNGRSAAPQATTTGGYPTYPGAGPTGGYGQRPQGGDSDPSTWQTGTGGPSVDLARMTIDSVVQKTGLTLVLLVLSAAATWILSPDQMTSGLYSLWIGAALVGIGLAFAVSFKKVVSPALVIAYALVEGIFIGAASKFFEMMWSGIVVNAVLGTLVAFGSTLAAYKFFNIQVTPKFRKFVTIAVMGFFAAVMLDFVLGFFGASFGFNALDGPFALVITLVGLLLGIFMLILDFDYVEKGVAVGLPEIESWRAAFGLTVTLVWIYIEMLRLMAILRGSD
ncbi:MAG: Bax inhibitor-1/YccA family protein [Actinomycetota bacterium]|jgi:uncharacterized YccA/Bax inhibitor family protein|nr:Bax inhibitor-1/YccA family protein [Actinomycetota bacterium]